MDQIPKPVRSALFAASLIGAAGFAMLPASQASPLTQKDAENPAATPSAARETDRLRNVALSDAFERPDTCRGFDPVKRYGPELQFQIRRNDAPVGRHSVTFNQGRDGLQVIAQSNIDISFLGFNAYSFAYRSESMWQGNQLTRLSVTVDDDGKKTSVRATRDQDRLIVDGPDGIQTVPAGIFPTDHWHCGVLAGKSVLNTITGKANAVDITPYGSEMLRTTNGTIQATEFTYDGELETNAWYDHQGRWVGLQFKARDGSTITYRCMNCQTRTARKDQG